MKKIKNKQAPARPVSAGKRVLFGTITILFPLLLVCLLEAGLRLGGYGENLSLFVSEDVGGKTLYVMNPDVKGRYFTHVGFSPNTSPDYFEIPKAKGAYRIFCLGGSTTVGFPYGYIGSFSTFLRRRMQMLFPGRQIEIINLGMTATNSYTVLDILRELFAYEPDLLIVYDGHNEFYGALGISSHESVSGSRWLTSGYLRLTRFRTFTLLRHGIEGIRHLLGGRDEAPPAAGTMMETLARNDYVAFDSPEYLACLDNFRANLREICDLASEHRVPLILTTQASNERDLFPFVSRNSPAYPKGDAVRYDILADTLAARASRGEADSVLDLSRRLLVADSTRADVHYCRAAALLLRGLPREAKKEYLLARDYDELRFRASADFNNAIREMDRPGQTYIADAERAFESVSPDSIIGSKLILEHLHPNLRGNFLLGKEYAGLIGRSGLFCAPAEWRERDTIRDERIFAASPITPLDLAAAGRRLLKLTGGWPFRRPVLPAASGLPAAVERILDRFTAGTMTWEEAHVAAAEYYVKSGDLASAEKEYAALADQFPHNVSAFLFLGRTLAEEHKTAEASEILKHSLSIEETPVACRLLATIALEAGNSDSAVTLARRAVGLSHDAEEELHSRYALALSLFRAGDSVASLRETEQALAISPAFGPAVQLKKRLVRE
ncbi:MAG TPA: hypothetical protein VMW43_00805 [Bacteroidota bacterium]|nr:hypothetical protein [Bacteroidota bacterium]